MCVKLKLLNKQQAEICKQKAENNNQQEEISK